MHRDQVKTKKKSDWCHIWLTSPRYSVTPPLLRYNVEQFQFSENVSLKQSCWFLDFIVTGMYLVWFSALADCCNSLCFGNKYSINSAKFQQQWFSENENVTLCCAIISSRYVTIKYHKTSKHDHLPPHFPLRYWQFGGKKNKKANPITVL